jgi:hypothetical protein
MIRDDRVSAASFQLISSALFLFMRIPFTRRFAVA